MTAPVDPRTTGTVLLAAGLLGIISNALHPIFPPDVSTEAFLRGAEASQIWLLVHLGLAASVVIATVGLRMLTQLLAATSGRTAAAVASGLATVTGAIFAAQLAGIDGVAIPTLATQLAEGGGEATLATARVWIAADLALLSVSVLGFLGGTNLALGWALVGAQAFSPWLRGAALAVGAAGIVVGVLMYLDIAPGVVLYAFRVVGLASALVGLALGFQLQRPGAVPAGSPPGVAPAGGVVGRAT